MEQKAKIYLYKKPIVTQNISRPILSTKLILILVKEYEIINKTGKFNERNTKRHPSISISFTIVGGTIFRYFGPDKETYPANQKEIAKSCG